MRHRLLVRADGATLTASLERRHESVWGHTAEAPDPEAAQQRLDEVLASDPIRQARPTVDLVLADPLVQLRSLRDLPPVRHRDLSAHIASSSARYFRKNGVPLVTAACWRAAPDAPRRTVARAAAVEMPWIEALEAPVRRAGFELRAVSPEGEPELQIHSPETRARRASACRRAIRRAVLANALAWLAVIGAALVRQQLDLRWLGREEQRLRPASNAVSTARARLHDVDVAIRELHQSDYTRKRALLALVSVLTALPDSAYLVSWEWHQDGTGTIAGAAPDAAAVLARLAPVPVLRSPVLAGGAPAESTAIGRRERFTIRFGARNR